MLATTDPSLLHPPSYKWGFKLSPSKSSHMLFTRKKGIDKHNLKLYGHNMETVDGFKYLGMCLDQKGYMESTYGKGAQKMKRKL